MKFTWAVFLLGSLAESLPQLNLSLSEPRTELSCAYAKGLLVCGGGLTPKKTVTDAVDVFDLANGGIRVETTPSRLSSPRALDGGQNTAVSCRGKVFIAGGADAKGHQSEVVDIFDASSRTWTNTTLSAKRSFLAATALENEGLVFFGGGELSEDEAHPEHSADTTTVDVWSVDKAAWLTPMHLGVPRKKLTATTVLDRYVIFAGGFLSNNGSEGYRDDVDIYDSTTGAWLRSPTVPPLSKGRMRLAAATVGNCAWFGGGEINVSQGDASGIVDVFCVDKVTNQWKSNVEELSVRRYELAAIAFDDRVYFGGGNIGVGGTDPMGARRIDVFDHAAETWTHFDLDTPRSRLAAAAGSGYVCFTGGASVDCLSPSAAVLLV